MNLESQNRFANFCAALRFAAEVFILFFCFTIGGKS
jgi:hypothetical protein